MPGTPKATVSESLSMGVAEGSCSLLPPQRQGEGHEDYSEENKTVTEHGETVIEKWAKINVPGYEDGKHTSYLREGSPDLEHETSATLPGLGKFMTWSKDD